MLRNRIFRHVLIDGRTKQWHPTDAESLKSAKIDDFWQNRKGGTLCYREWRPQTGAVSGSFCAQKQIFGTTKRGPNSSRATRNPKSQGTRPIIGPVFCARLKKSCFFSSNSSDLDVLIFWRTFRIQFIQNVSAFSGPSLYKIWVAVPPSSKSCIQPLLDQKSYFCLFKK